MNRPFPLTGKLSKILMATFFLGIVGLAYSEDKVDFLSSKLQDSSFKVRLKAAVMMGRMADVRAVAPLCKALQDENYVVRGAAARALGNLGNPAAVAAVDPLFRLIRDEESFVRKEAVQALERLVGAETLHAIVAALSSDDSAMRVTAVHLLALINQSDARSAILSALGDGDEEVRIEAVTAIKGMKPEEREKLLIAALGKKDNYQVQVAAAKLIGETNLTSAADALADLLVSNDVVPEVQKEATSVLSNMKQRLDVAALVAATKSSDRSVQDRAIKLLGIHGGPEAVNALLGMLQHNEPFVRLQAVFALGDSKDPKAIPALEALLKSETNPRSKEWIERTLRKLRP